MTAKPCYLCDVGYIHHQGPNHLQYTNHGWRVVACPTPDPKKQKEAE